MKTRVLFGLITLLFIPLISCHKNDADNITVAASVKFMVISDIHYFDPSLFSFPLNPSFQAYLAGDRKLIAESSAILQNVLASVLTAKPDFLLITGDLTKDGEKFDHQALAVLFKALSDKGIKVLVIPGNHDVNNPSSYSYLQSARTKIDNVTAADFASIYADCGYGNAVERDPGSLSYVSEPVSGVWILGIDACQYSPLSLTAGTLSAGTLTWVKSIIDKSKQQNKILISMMHHGLTEHFSGQSTLFPEYIISDWQNISAALADYGLTVVFTGHFHAQDITKITGAKGFSFDIETGSTVTYSCPYRMVTLNTLSKSLQISSGKIDGITFSTIPAGTNFQQYAKEYLNAGTKLVSYGMLSAPPYGIPAATITALQLDRIMANAFVAHSSGDELPSASDNSDIQTVKTTIPLFAGAVEGVWTDLAPADNKVILNLATGTSVDN